MFRNKKSKNNKKILLSALFNLFLLQRSQLLKTKLLKMSKRKNK